MHIYHSHNDTTNRPGTLSTRETCIFDRLITYAGIVLKYLGEAYAHPSPKHCAQAIITVASRQRLPTLDQNAMIDAELLRRPVMVYDDRKDKASLDSLQVKGCYARWRGCR